MPALGPSRVIHPSSACACKKREQDGLAGYYLRAAAVAAIWIDCAGHIGGADVAMVDEHPSRIIYCCLRGDQFRVSYHLYEWKQSVQASPEAIARKLEEWPA